MMSSKRFNVTSASFKQISLTTLLIALNCSVIWAIDKEQEKAEKIVERKVSLGHSPFLTSTLEASVDIGSVPANTSVLLKLDLVNPFERSLVITSLGAGCRCLNSNMRGEIRAKSITPVEVTLKTQAHSPTVDHKQYLRFSEASEDTGGFNLVVSYRLEGLLSFTRDSHYERIPEVKARSGTRFRVPFVSSNPVVVKDVAISLTNELQHGKARLVEDNGISFVEIDFKHNLIGESLPGEVVLKERHAKTDARIPVFIQVEKDVAIAPYAPKFIWAEDKRAYTASAFVRVSSSKNTPETSLKVRAWLPDAGDAKLTTNVKKLNDRVARVEHILDFDGEKFVKGGDPRFKNRLAIEVTGKGIKHVEDQEFEIFP
jgi:hypothetical protein